MKLKFSKYLVVSLIGLIMSCSDEDIQTPLEQNDTPPQQVTDVQVENLPGKARLTYTLPVDQDLLYVQANYTLENGRDRSKIIIL